MQEYQVMRFGSLFQDGLAFLEAELNRSSSEKLKIIFRHIPGGKHPENALLTVI
jgi:hypothetical protein